MIALCCVAGLAGADHTPSSAIIERAVASVDGRVITLTELEFEARVALIQRGGLGGAADPLDEEALRGALQLSISERLETAEADKLQAFEVSEDEIDAAYQSFRARFDSEKAFNEFLARHEADLQQLKVLLGRRLRTEKILDSKILLRARISEAEVRRYFEQHRTELGGKYGPVRDQIRDKLVRDRYAALAKDELNQIRQGSDVRLIAPFARALRPIEP